MVETDVSKVNLITILGRQIMRSCDVSIEESTRRGSLLNNTRRILSLKVFFCTYDTVLDQPTGARYFGQGRVRSQDPSLMLICVYLHIPYSAELPQRENKRQ